jgi:hypothetical protein
MEKYKNQHGKILKVCYLLENISMHYKEPNYHEKYFRMNLINIICKIKNTYKFLLLIK